MLVDFEVENFRSYHEARRLSMVASSTNELAQNVIDTNLGFKLVRSAVLYGANASGKSNLLLAMNWVGSLLKFSKRGVLTAGSAHAPFALDRKSSSRPTRFRVRFLLEGVLYDYTIAVSREAVLEEHLVVCPRGRPQQWFDRKGNEIIFNEIYIKGNKQSLRRMTPHDVPLLAVAEASDHPRLSPPARWLAKNLRNSLELERSAVRIGSTIAIGAAEITALRCQADGSFLSWVNALLRHADLGIQGVEIELNQRKYSEPTMRRMPDGLSVIPVEDPDEESPELFIVHGGDGGKPVRFRLSDESQGTRRLIEMLLPLYELLRAAELAIVDEMDESFHPSIIREIIRVFHDPQLNSEGAQIVFATHDTSLLSGQLFRRDQVWFTEKDASGATDLYSLNDIKGVREDDSFEQGLPARPLWRDPVLRLVRLPDSLARNGRSGPISSRGVSSSRSGGRSRRGKRGKPS